MKFLKILVLLLLVTACKNNTIKKPVKPDNLIPKDKMVDVLYDMSLMSAAKGVSRRAIESKGVNPEEFIYTKHNIDSLQFALSNAYYAHDIDGYEKLYERVSQRLEADKSKFKKQQELQQKAKDSIIKRNQVRIDSLKKLGKDKYGKQIKNMKKDFTPNRLKTIDSSAQLKK